jgi:voltage-gated potassium channel
MASSLRNQNPFSRSTFEMSPQRRFQVSLLTLASLIGLGTAVFHFLERYSWLDSFYLTVATLATVGYGDVSPKTVAGRMFTAGFILVSITVVGAAVQALIQGEILSTFSRRRMFKDISQLSDHFILCGAGRVGVTLIKEMERTGAEFVIIERDEQVAERLLSQGYLTLNGDASEEEILLGAQIDRARGLVCCTPSDADNVYITLTARGLNPDLYIVARAITESAIEKLRKAGADKIVSPTIIGSHIMAQVLLRPAVGDFIELTAMTDTMDLVIEQVELADDSPLVGKFIRDCGIRSELNAIIVAIKRGAQASLFNPPGDTTLQAGDILVVIGNREALETLESTANPSRTKSTRKTRR